MKLSAFKKLIREVIREELDYKFSQLEKKLNEVIVTGNNVNIVKDKRQATQDTSLKKMVNSPVGSSVSTPKTSNSVLNNLLKETAQSDDWKTVEGKGEAEVQSVQDNTEQLPEHLANAFTKDYSKIMKKVEEKDNFKNGA
tara:strand:+ start:119 stop:538 length:420 start_codon:yes stop_codon:yes gene_type:complete